MIDTDKLKAAALAAELREYASNPGYSHNDYADPMRAAADMIEELERKLAESERHRAELSGVLRAVHDAEFGYGQWPSEQVISEVLEGTPVEAERRQVSEGWKLVPKELTQEMRVAWDRTPASEDDDVDMRNAYRSMIAAAPEKPE